MAANYDASEFIDGDFQRQKLASTGAQASGASADRAPTREEVDTRVAEAQQKLAELKRAQEELERERAMLEETRRRQTEFQTGRQEMVQNLTRGLGLLEEAEFAARKDAEQMTKAIAELRDAMTKVQAINEETWTRESFSVQLTQALTTLENARMEWNSARLKFPVLSGAADLPSQAPQPGPQAAASGLTGLSAPELFRVGLALTWPVAVAVLAVGLLLLILLTRN